MRLLFAVLAFVIGAAVAAALAGASSWKHATQASIAELAPVFSEPALFETSSVDALPAPVARYLRTAITNDHPIVRTAIATQEAEFYINGGWRPLTATQHFSVSPPGFVWDARIQMAPLMPALVRDSYINRSAAMQASLYGAYTMVNERNKPQLDSGALQRFLGEAIWFPTALLPSAAIHWTSRDDRSAFVTLQDGATTVTMLFEFGEDGMPVTISGDRFKEDRGSYTMQPWQIRCDRHELHDGLTIPSYCDVAWIVNGTRQPYWRGRITSINYQYDRLE